ncbi:MAG: S8 family peptidase [Polyangiaceae bacterium]
MGVLTSRYGFGLAVVSMASACSGGDWQSAAEGEGSEQVARVSSAVSAPNDPNFGLQWGLRNTGQTVPTEVDGNSIDVKGTKGLDLGILSAWDVTQGSPSVIVAVIEEGETGITHPDLKPNFFVNTREVAGDGKDNDANGYIDDVTGFDFKDRDGWNEPYSEHATHVAGIIGAKAGNGLGIAGVAPLVKILPLRAESSSASMVEAIAYAKKMGAKIVSVSQGGFFDYSTAVYNAIRDSGMLFVCSAGNDGTAKYNYPSGYDLSNIISVANVGPSGAVAPFSSYGEAHVDIAAPGMGIYSAFNGGGYGYIGGTSQAAPHVAGVAALLWSKYPTLTLAQVVSRILDTGIKMSTLRGVVKSGAMVDAAAALLDVAPITLSASTTPGKVVLSWNAQSGATRYDVERDGSVASNTSTTYTHSSLSVDSAHIYRVRAITSSGTGAWSRKLYTTASAEPTVEAVTSYSSPHPYTNNQSKVVPITRRNAKRLRAHFTRVDMGSGDYLWYAPTWYQSYDDNKLSGSYPTGFWTHWVGDTFTFEFHSDATGTAWGYDVDKIEYVLGIPDAPAAPVIWDFSSTYVNVNFTPTGACYVVSIYRSTSSSSGYAKIGSADPGPGEYIDSTVKAAKTYYYKVSCKNESR